MVTVCAEVYVPPTGLNVGAATVTGKPKALEVPPPGVGFTTVIESIPLVATSLAGIDAVTCVSLT